MIGPDSDDEEKARKPKTTREVITLIVIMNLIFSFDSILSAMALVSGDPASGGSIAYTTNDIIIMSTAIIIGGLLMIWLADRVSDFLQKNRMYEVLGLFVLFIVGVMLITEGGHLAEITILGNPVEKMSKTTFYFVIGALVTVDLVQSRYQKKLLAHRDALDKLDDIATDNEAS
jgi:predicted tellurium resistance membrane protein TerC